MARGKTPSVDPEVETLVRAREIVDAYDVPLPVARRLWERFGSVDLDEVDRDQLREVTGIGETTAKLINPPRSRAFRAREREASGEALIPTWGPSVHPYDDEKLRLPDEDPERAKNRLARAHSVAATLRRGL